MYGVVVNAFGFINMFAGPVALENIQYNYVFVSVLLRPGLSPRLTISIRFSSDGISLSLYSGISSLWKRSERPWRSSKRFSALRGHRARRSRRLSRSNKVDMSISSRVLDTWQGDQRRLYLFARCIGYLVFRVLFHSQSFILRVWY